MGPRQLSVDTVNGSLGLLFGMLRRSLGGESTMPVPDLSPTSWLHTSATTGKVWLHIQEALTSDTQLGSHKHMVSLDSIARIEEYTHQALDPATMAEVSIPGMARLITSSQEDPIDTLYRFSLLTAAVLGVPWPYDANGMDSRLAPVTAINPLAPPA